MEGIRDKGTAGTDSKRQYTGIPVRESSKYCSITSKGREPGCSSSPFHVILEATMNKILVIEEDNDLLEGL